MEKWVGNILIDVSPPERAKFKSPLVLVHGLWMSSRCWRPWATRFSNLGWECWAVNFRGRFGENAMAELERVTFSDCVSDLKQVIRAAPFPPVVVAHDLGGLVALKALQQEKASALVLLASLPPCEVAPEISRPLKLMRLKYGPLLFLRRPFRLDEKDFRAHWLNAVPENRHAEPFRCLVMESTHLIGEFFARRVALDGKPISAQTLIVAGGDDRLAPAAALRDLSVELGADFRDYPGRGHWIMDEAAGENMMARDIHRWIVQETGGELLLEPSPEEKL
jgi:pimeloyl-ACP methyl ester carboxylesterase